MAKLPGPNQVREVGLGRFKFQAPSIKADPNEGAGLEAIGSAVTGEARVRQDKANRVENDELDMALSKKLRELNDGTRTVDPATGKVSFTGGYAQLKGRNAEEAYEDHEKAVRAAYNEVLGTAKNSVTRAEFSKIGLRKRELAISNASKHRFAQGLQADETTSKAIVRNETDDAVRYANEGYSITKIYADRVHKERKRRAIQDQGLDEVAAERVADEATSALHKSVVVSLISKGDVAAADKYLKQVMTEKDPSLNKTEEAALRDMVREKENLEVTQNVVDTAASTYKLHKSDGARLAMAYIRSDKTLTAEQRKAAEAALTSRIAEDTRIHTAALNEQQSDVYTRIFEGSITSRTQIPIELWSSLSGNNKAAMERAIRRVATGEEPIHNPEAFARLLDELQTPEGIAQTQVQLTGIWGGVLDRQSLAAAQNILRSQKAAAAQANQPEDSAGILNAKERVTQTLADYGIIDTGKARKDWSDAEKRNELQFRVAVDNAVVAWENTKNQTADAIQQKKIVRDTAARMLLPLISDPADTGLFGGAKKGEEEFKGYVMNLSRLSPKQMMDARVPYADIPPRILTATQAVFASRGRRMTQRSAGQFAIAMTLNNRARMNQILGSAQVLGAPQKAVPSTPDPDTDSSNDTVAVP